MELLPNDDDYCCFLDGDATFTTTFFGLQLERIVHKYPECGVFVCMTNRVNCEWQLETVDWDSDDIKYHRFIGDLLADDNYYQIKDVTNKPKGEVLSGVLMLIRKDVWKKIGGFKDGMLGVDNDLHWKCQKHGEKVYLLRGFYVYHWYRGGIKKNKEHLL